MSFEQPEDLRVECQMEIKRWLWFSWETVSVRGDAGKALELRERFLTKKKRAKRAERVEL